MTLVTWMQCCKAQGWLAFTSLLLFTLSILLKPLSNLRALVTQMQLLRDEACWHLSIILCIWAAWGKPIIITIHCIVKLCLYLWDLSLNQLGDEEAQQILWAVAQLLQLSSSLLQRSSQQAGGTQCPSGLGHLRHPGAFAQRKMEKGFCFFFSPPKVGAHNRVPSKQLYYWVTKPLMRYPLEKLSGCCFLIRV